MVPGFFFFLFLLRLQGLGGDGMEGSSIKYRRHSGNFPGGSNVMMRLRLEKGSTLQTAQLIYLLYHTGIYHN